jgi:membrane carboxypeptidase/penicillin-binding protein
LFETLGLSLWWRIRLSHDELIALYVSQAWLGYRPMGFSAASRAYFGLDLNVLTPDEQRCLARKLLTPSARDYRCGSGR